MRVEGLNTSEAFEGLPFAGQRAQVKDMADTKDAAMKAVKDARLTALANAVAQREYVRNYRHPRLGWLS